MPGPSARGGIPDETAVSVADDAAAATAATTEEDVFARLSTSNVMPKILSHAIATPADYARLRAVSPAWNASLLPRALKAARNLRNCDRTKPRTAPGSF